MSRRVFYSFHYADDNWRVSQVRNLGAVQGSPLVADTAWEEIKRGGDRAIQRWIDAQLARSSCCVVLIGQATADRRWVRYEIERAWQLGKGVLGVHVHRLKDRDGRQSWKGSDPLQGVSLGWFRSVGDMARTYDPPYTKSNDVYRYIAVNLANWVEEAVALRKLADERR